LILSEGLRRGNAARAPAISKECWNGVSFRGRSRNVLDVEAAQGLRLQRVTKGTKHMATQMSDGLQTVCVSSSGFGARFAGQPIDVSDVVHRMDIEDQGQIVLNISGTDRTGIIEYVSRMTAECNVNILDSFTARLGEQHFGTFLIIDGEPSDIRRFHERLNDTKSDMVVGKLIFPAKLYTIRIEGDDRIGMLYDISRILTEHDINIATMGSRTLVTDIIGDVVHRRAFIHIRAEAPAEQLQAIDAIEREIRRIDPKWCIDIQEHSNGAAAIAESIGEPRL
jgi:glycine cleavage system regulatory protein